MTFSLILCTVGRDADVVGEFFESLVRQNRKDYELILVDQNNDDRLVPLVAQYAGRFRLCHVRSTTRGLSRARNLGLRQAKGTLVGFPDDDCVYLGGFLDRVARAFETDPGLGGLTGYPTADRSASLADWRSDTMPLDRVAVLNRCQEFTIFVRRDAMGAVRFNDSLGVGAGTPWGADEGPDFLIRVIEGGARIVFYPHFFVYHPDKVRTVTPELLKRAASYARGRGCFFRLHRFPLPIVARSLYRTAGGVVVYLILLQPKRARYYAAVLSGLLRGLRMSRDELAAVRPGIAAADVPVIGGVRVNG